MSTIYNDMLNTALKIIADKTLVTSKNRGQRLVADNLLSFLSGNGLNAVLIEGGTFLDIHVQLFNGSNSPDSNCMIRVFNKLNNDIIQNFKVKYLPSIITQEIDGNERAWKDFTTNDELIDLIKREMLDVYIYKLKK